MKKLISALSILLVLAMALTLASCGEKKPDGDSGTASGDKGFVARTVGTNDYLGRFLAGINPAESWMGCDAIYDSSFILDPATKQRTSLILKDWHWEDDTTFVMEMRDDIYFSNGDNATAEDMLFSYNSHVVRGSNYLNNFGIIWEESKVLDKYTVSFKLETPYPKFVNTTIYLISKKWSEEVGYDSMEWYNNPVGSGPYKVKEYVADDHFVLVSRGEDYWRYKEDPIYVDQWTVKYYPDGSVMYMALETGEVDLAAVPSADYSRYIAKKGEGFEVMLCPDGSVLQFCFNFQDSKIDWENNKDLRYAFAIGIDWKTVGKLALGDMYGEALSVGPKLSPDFINPGQYEYNPEKAKEILAGFGYTAENPLKIYSSTMDNPMLKGAFESFIYQAGQINVVATVDFKDTSAALGDWLSPSDFDYGFWWAVGGSPSMEVWACIQESWDPSGVRFDYIPFKEYLEHFEVVLRSTDAAKVSENLKWLQQYMFDEVGYIPVGEVNSAVGWRDGKFTEAQIKNGRVSAGNYQLSRMGLASAWK